MDRPLWTLEMISKSECNRRNARKHFRLRLMGVREKKKVAGQVE